MRILAIDLGKASGVACDLDTATGGVAYETIPMRRASLEEALSRRRPDRLVVEASPGAAWVHDAASALGIEVQVANPNHDAWRWRNVKRKTDRLDALKLARRSATGDLALVHMPRPDVRQWRSLIAYRHQLVKRRTQAKNHVRAVLFRQGLEMPPGTCGWTIACRDCLRQLCRPPVPTGQGDEVWRAELAIELDQLEAIEGAVARVHRELDRIAKLDGRAALLRTIPGVGPRLSELIVAMIDDPHRFRSGRQVGAYAGLTPGCFQSGEMERSMGISKRGNPLLRSLLVEVSWLALRYNGWAADLHARLTRGSRTRRKIAIVGVARRLLVICWAMLRDGTPWNEARAASVWGRGSLGPDPAVGIDGSGEPEPGSQDPFARMSIAAPSITHETESGPEDPWAKTALLGNPARPAAP